jgi:hypothetical protein
MASTLNKIETEKLWARAKNYAFNGQEIKALSFEDDLLTLALQVRHDWPHLKLFRLVDINEILTQKKDSLDWPYIWTAASRYHLEKTLNFALFITGGILKFSLPKELTESLEKKSLRNKIYSGFVLEYVHFLENHLSKNRNILKTVLFKILAMDSFGELATILTHENNFYFFVKQRFFRLLIKLGLLKKRPGQCRLCKDRSCFESFERAATSPVIVQNKNSNAGSSIPLKVLILIKRPLSPKIMAKKAGFSSAGKMW